MTKTTTLKLIAAFLFVGSTFSSCSSTAEETKGIVKDYESYENDPMQTRIYTLDNGLKVYLSVNDEAPRVNTAIAVRAGSKNDPENATGLAHYLEHMLFKGTSNYGTLDFDKEGPLLIKIDSLYEVYRLTSDSLQRAKIYADIDSISQIASTYAIANEYDKMVSQMGAKGTNAYTSQEETVYINDIPSNQLGKWLKLEHERFTDPQMRLFHTELEAVYEEKNRGLDSDYRKAWEATMEGLFPNHQYGQQTTIGTIEHLKNPSISEIKKYFDKYYVPNNMAIVMSGDFNPDSVIQTIRNTFGKMSRKEDPSFEVRKEEALAGPIVKEVKGPDSEFMYMAYRFDGQKSDQIPLLRMCDMMLANNTAGLIDLNINQEQKALEAGCFPYILTDYSAHIFNAKPKEGQSLEDVKNLLLAQIDSLKKGNFPDWLPEAAVNDMKLQEIKNMDNNNGRTRMMVNAFVQKIPWEEKINELDKLKEISKEDIVQFANSHYNDNYVVVNKRTGKDENIQKVVKPNITPVEVNRQVESDFLADITSMKTASIEPVFLDYDKDISKAMLDNGLEIRSIENERNELFYLYYLFDMGKNNNKKLDLAIEYLPFLGSSKYTAAEIQQEFYKIGCSFNVSAGEEQVYVQMSGLDENFEKGLELFEHLLADAQEDEEALENLIADKIKRREDAKLSKGEILFGGMYNYAIYGENSPFRDILSEEEMKEIKASELTDIIHNLHSYPHRVLYYGPKSNSELSESIVKSHKMPKEFKEIPKEVEYVEMDNEATKVYVVDYDMKQAEIVMLSKGEKYNAETVALAAIFNEYFGGGMGSIVFQEMRESKALAYSVYSVYRSPSDSSKSHYVMAYIGTQADKLGEAMEGMSNLLNDMPESEKSFELAKKAALEKIRTERITKTSKLWNYETALKRGVDRDLREDVYKAIPKMTMADLKAFHQNIIKERNYNIMVIGNKNELDSKALAQYGEVKYLSLEDVFGY